MYKTIFQCLILICTIFSFFLPFAFFFFPLLDRQFCLFPKFFTTPIFCRSVWHKVITSVSCSKTFSSRINIAFDFEIGVRFYSFIVSSFGIFHHNHKLFSYRNRLHPSLFFSVRPTFPIRKSPEYESIALSNFSTDCSLSLALTFTFCSGVICS